MRRRAEAVNELGHEAHDDDARVEAGEIHDVMQLEIIHHEQISALESDLLVAHAEMRRPVQREEKLEPLVPRAAACVPPRCEMEELDGKWEFLVKGHRVTPARIEVRRNVVRLEFQPPAHSEQIAECGSGRRMCEG